MKRITYAVDKETGQVISRMGSIVAIPVLDYPPASLTAPLTYHLESFYAYELSDVWQTYRWTRKLPRKTKNMHRAFWGLPLLNATKKGRDHA